MVFFAVLLAALFAIFAGDDAVVIFKTSGCQGVIACRILNVLVCIRLTYLANFAVDTSGATARISHEF
jgi:hypothetical protein